MVWQDIVITASIVIMSYALVPQVIMGFRKRKKLVSLQTSFITSGALYTLTFVFFTLGLIFSAIMDFVIASLWLILFVQGIVYK